MTPSEIKSLQRINQKLALIRGSKSDRSQQKGLYLQQQRETLLIKHVLKAHPEMEMILNENRALLANKRTMFKVYTQGRTAFGTHATRLIETIRSNGFLYLENSKNMFPIPYVSQHLFPKEFSGQLNWAGKIEMRMTGISFQFIGSQIPTKLEGSITESNRIAVVTTSSEFEWDGTGYLEKLVCDPFNGNEQARSTYLENRMIVYKKMKAIELQFLNSRP